MHFCALALWEVGNDDDGVGVSRREDQWRIFIDLLVPEAAIAGFSGRNLESLQGAREIISKLRLLLKVQLRNLVSLLG